MTGFRIVAALCAAFAAGCGGGGAVSAPPPPPTPPISTVLVTVSGSVRDDYTANPIPGATISSNGKTTTTGEDGRFSLDGVSTGLIAGQPVATLVSIQATGFDSWSQPVPVPGGAGSISVDLFRSKALVASGDFLIYLPPPNAPIRGVFVNLFNNTNGDSRPIIRGELSYYDGVGSLPSIPDFRRKMMAFARAHSLAIMGTQLAFTDTARAAWIKTADALKEASINSGRIELADAPLVVHGFALGGCVAFGLAATYPQRVMGFIAQKGGLCLTLDNTPARTVPGYFIHGGGDNTPGLFPHIQGIFNHGRAAGAKWALGIEPNGLHVLLSNHDLLFNYLEDVVSRRLPDVVGAGTAVPKPVSEESGWLGDQSSYVIGAWQCYTANRNAASWLPSQRTAAEWQALMSLGGTKTIFPCPAS